MIEPLCSELGYLGTTSATQQILAGMYKPPPWVDDLTREFLSFLQAMAPLDLANHISCKITRQDFQYHWWKKAKQRVHFFFLIWFALWPL